MSEPVNPKLIAIVMAIVISAMIYVEYVISPRSSNGADVERFVAELTVRGETHEYIQMQYGMTHLPNCKFCVNKREEEEQ